MQHSSVIRLGIRSGLSSSNQLSLVELVEDADIFIQSGVIDIFSEIQHGGSRSWIFRLCEFGYSGMMIVWYLCSVPNLVQIYVIVTEIDALMLLNFI